MCTPYQPQLTYCIYSDTFLDGWGEPCIVGPHDARTQILGHGIGGHQAGGFLKFSY